MLMLAWRLYYGGTVITSITLRYAQACHETGMYIASCCIEGEVVLIGNKHFSFQWALINSPLH